MRHTYDVSLLFRRDGTYRCKSKITERDVGLQPDKGVGNERQPSEFQNWEF